MRIRHLPLLLSALICWAAPSPGETFKVGYAERDITPQAAMPMWGYGARHDVLSEGVRDPLYAKGVVIEVGDKRLAIIGLDLGRGPTAEGMDFIRENCEEVGVEHFLISGSHTHHGPVIELKDEEGKGKGKFDDAVQYTKDLNQNLVDLIKEAAGKVQEAKIGWASAEVDMNRNRHSKIEPKPRETGLNVVRFDNAEGKPIALLVNFAAHPTMLDGADLRFSAEYPGEMRKRVESELGAPCFFMQGAAGDMSVKTTEETKGVEAFGKALGEEVLKINRNLSTETPAEPSLKVAEDTFTFDARPDLQNPFLQEMLRRAFFPEMVDSFLDELENNQLKPVVTTVLLNGQLAMVGASGEFFSQHSNRLKERCRAEKTLFFGYCNGHHMYFPTIEGAAEGGYGADATVSWVALGAGERMMDTALIHLYRMLGRYEDSNLGR
jgi:hypothetical protein